MQKKINILSIFMLATCISFSLKAMNYDYNHDNFRKENYEKWSKQNYHYDTDLKNLITAVSLNDLKKVQELVNKNLYKNDNDDILREYEIRTARERGYYDIILFLLSKCSQAVKKKIDGLFGGQALVLAADELLKDEKNKNKAIEDLVPCYIEKIKNLENIIKK